MAKDNSETNPITIKLKTAEPRDRAVLLGPLTLLLSTRVPFPNKISCFVSRCVSSDHSFLSARQETSFGPWKGSPFLQQKDNIFLYEPFESEVAQSCPTLCYPVDCSPPGSSVHGIFQARILEWVAISFSTIQFLNSRRKVLLSLFL